MKKKYTLEIANSQINIITEEDKETLDAVVGIVDRKIREVYLHSKGECSRTNAAILVCLDYCAEKFELQKTLKNLNSEIERLTILNEAAEKEKAALERELEALRSTINTGVAHKPTTRRLPVEQIAFDDIVAEEITTLEAPVTAAPEVENDKPHVRLKKKKVRAMFDNIAFDDI
jgi:cell division protein ZapA (FtsZ GTPase activity inhibitor)